MKTYGYIRVSRVNGRGGESFRSPADQRASIERLAAQHKLTVDEYVEELDVSGGKDIDDRDLGRIVSEIIEAKGGTVIVWNVKRYSRDKYDGLRTAMDVFQAGGRLLAEDFQMEGMGALGALAFALEYAEEERRQKTEAWGRAVNGAISRGVYVGPTPVGYRKGADKRLVKIGGDVESAIVRCFEVRASGGSWNAAARALEDAGVQTSGGATRWHINSVRSLVGNRVYKGELKNGATHRFPEYAMVTPETWQSAQGDVTGPRKGTAIGSRAVLAGLLVCSGCGNRMAPTSSTVRGKEYRAYQCKNRACDHRAYVQADDVEAYVTEQAFQYFELLGPHGYGRAEDVEASTRLQHAVTEAEEAFATFVAVVHPGDPGFAERVAEMRDGIEVAKAALIEEQTRSHVDIAPDELRGAWDAATLDDRRALARKMLMGATVERGKGTVEERVTVEFQPWARRNGGTR